MNEKIKNFMQSHTKINYFQRCFRRCNDKEFVKEVLDIGKDPLRIKINCLGEKNPGRLIYICQTAGCDGLFAELRYILAEIYFAVEFGMIPVVLIPPTSCYCEQYPVNGTMNPFEYYFEKVSDVTLEDALQSKAVVEHNYYQRLYIESKCNMNSGYLPSEEYIQIMAQLVKQYLHLNEFCKESIKSDINETIGNKITLGVHVRGADFKRNYKNHPNMVSIEEYVQVVEKQMKRGGFEQIFLATDDSIALEMFQKTFSNKIVYYKDVIRTDGNETVMRSINKRANHHYKLGYEVLRDMYTLSECQGIVAGLSNVSIFSRIVKMSHDKDFSIREYLNKGINR